MYDISISIVGTPKPLHVGETGTTGGVSGGSRSSADHGVIQAAIQANPRPGTTGARCVRHTTLSTNFHLHRDIPPAMADDDARSPAPTPGISVRRAMSSSESPQLRQRSQQGVRLGSDAPLPPGGPGVRRRSSNFSDYSLNEARRSFQSSTDDLLLPRAPRGDAGALPAEQESSAWHSAPLAFALLPAVGGMLFKNGSSVITDVMLLGLAAIFLNWSVRLPWFVDYLSLVSVYGWGVLMMFLRDWYQSAQAIRTAEEEKGDVLLDADSEDESALSMSQATLDEVPEDAPPPPPKPTRKPRRRRPAHAEAAAKELYRHELLALLSCFVAPLLGAYLLHTLRDQLSRPSEGLVSNYNLTIFLLASELRPMAHLVKLVQSRTLHLQRIVNSNPYTTVDAPPVDTKTLLHRLEELESRPRAESPGSTNAADANLNGKLTAEVRREIQPDLDALTRAVRRYEKRATLQAFQTETKLLDLEARVGDAVSLAAAAVSKRDKAGFSGWVTTAVTVPLQILGAIAGLPFTVISSLVGLVRLGGSPARGQTPAARKRPPSASASAKGVKRFQWAGVKR